MGGDFIQGAAGGGKVGLALIFSLCEGGGGGGGGGGGLALIFSLWGGGV